MATTVRSRILIWSGTFVFALLLVLFYWKYVPLIKSYQTILLPLLLLTAMVTAIDVFKGILIFVFLFPLINNLPYFFGIDSHIPHAPAALILFGFFLLGWLVHRCRLSSFVMPRSTLLRPLGLLAAVIVVSGLINLLRFSLSLPCLSCGFRDAVMNVNGLSAGGAVMSVIFNGLNYLSGFMFFFILLPFLGDRKRMTRILGSFSLSFLMALLFGVLQHYHSVRLGNMNFWISKGQINATFKDPNSLALVLSAFIPLLMGMLLSAGWKRRILLAPLLGLALFVFPFTGSRISLLGLAGGVTGFLILALNVSQQNRKRRAVFLVVFLAAALLSFSLFLSLAPTTQLAMRFQRTWDLVIQGDSLKEVFTSRLDFWPAAWKMLKEYPLSGVGLGGFIVELPNYLKAAGARHQYTDSTENFFLQIASELGLVGMAVYGWLFWLIFVQIKSRWRLEKTENRKSKFLFIGLSASFFSIFINVFFHSYIGAFDAKYFIWLLIALLFADGRDNGAPDKRGLPAGRKRFPLVVVLILLFGGVHFWQAFHSLSTDMRMKRFQWEQQSGFYAWEQDEDGFDFRWMGKTAVVAMEQLSGSMIIPVRCSHPDLGLRPVTLQIYGGDPCLRNLSKIAEFVFRDSLWHDVELSIPEVNRNWLYLKLEVDRIWQPSQWGSADSRKLGAAVGRMWFRSSLVPSKNDLKTTSSRKYYDWRGKQKAVMSAKGVSRLLFYTPGPDSLLRLVLKGNKSGGNGPYVIVRIDERIVGKIVLESEKWSTFEYFPELDAGYHRVSVEFLNPDGRPGGFPRMVWLGALEVHSPSGAALGPP